MILQSQPIDPDAWQILAVGDCVLALPSDAGTRFDGLGELLAGPDPFRVALEALVSSGIAGAPSFALLQGDTEVLRLVLRGDAVVAVTRSDAAVDAAEVTVSGIGMATWSERVIEGARSLRLQVPGSTWTVGFAAPTAHPAAPAPASAPPASAPPASAPPASAPPASASPAPASAPAETTLVPRADPPTPVTPPPAAAAALLPEEEPEPPAEPYDFLFGDTIYRTHAGLAVRIPNPDPTRPGDHDGQTMLAEDLKRIAQVAVAQGPPVEPVAPSPLAELVETPPVQAPTPPPAATLQLERAGGIRESLSQPVVIGRAPRASATASPSPRLITIADDKDISRSHVRIAVEGDAVVVTDLGSKNGTVITLPGAAPRTLRASEPTVVLPDTLIDLGGGVTFTVRED